LNDSTRGKSQILSVFGSGDQFRKCGKRKPECGASVIALGSMKIERLQNFNMLPATGAMCPAQAAVFVFSF